MRVYQFRHLGIQTEYANTFISRLALLFLIEKKRKYSGIFT